MAHTDTHVVYWQCLAFYLIWRDVKECEQTGTELIRDFYVAD